MLNLATIIILLTVVTALAEITDRVKISYPILLVIAGMFIGFIPGLPVIELNPEIVFLVFLPPILYSAAWNTSWPDFVAAKRPITLLAIGCVIFTTCLTAWVAHTFIPGMGWAEAFVLGAIISPPDAVAATSVFKGLGVPKRVETVLEGESLVNDATGLTAYNYAVAAVVTGTFHLMNAGVAFLWMAMLGILIGLGIGYIFKWIHQITRDNPTTDTTLTFLVPFIAYLTAEAVHASGVLAVVTAGLFLAWNSSIIFSQQTRIQASASWNTVIFMLNGIVFILIGLQLPKVISSIKELSLGDLITYGGLVSLGVIIGRIIWVYPGAYVPRWLSRGIREREPETNIKMVTIVAWSGMRGVVSLAAALALPLAMEDGSPFPNRDLIIFLTFSVIFSTLVLQGLTLRPLIKWFNIGHDGNENRKELEIRLLLANRIIEYIEENFSLGVSEEVLNQVKTKYEIRIARIRKDEAQYRLGDGQILAFQQIQQELLNIERQEIIQLRNRGRISAELLRKLEYELDLEETRLMLERGLH